MSKINVNFKNQFQKLIEESKLKHENYNCQLSLIKATQPTR